MKSFVRKIYDKLGLVPTIAIILLFSWVVLSYVSQKELHLKYEAIEFRDSHTDEVKILNVQIDGTYSTTLLGEKDEFTGTIIIGDNEFRYLDYPLKFSKYGMAFLDSAPFNYDNPGTLGAIYTDRYFKKMTIERYSKSAISSSDYEFNGWRISAPSQNRDDAVCVANELIQKERKGYRVK